MPPGSAVSGDSPEARAFADSVAGVLERHRPLDPHWIPGEQAASEPAELETALDALGWDMLSRDPELVAFAGLGAVQLGRRLAPLRQIDRLLGGAPSSGALVRSLGGERVAIMREDSAVVRRAVLMSEPLASAEGLAVHRVLELGDGAEVDEVQWRTASAAWMAAVIGYLGGLGQGALEMTVQYVGQRRAFGGTLAGLAPVQQLLADAATAIRGVLLLAADTPGADALAHSGPAVAQACAACQQVTGAIGFTLEYPLHRHTQRARALATWNDALGDVLLRPRD